MISLRPSDHSALALVGGVAAILIAFKVIDIVYSVYFHPLRRIPGPWWAAASRLPYANHLIRGTSVSYLQSLHLKHGPIVRYSPNEISVTNGDQAWQEIYGFRTAKQKDTQSFEKDVIWYPPAVDGVPSLFIAPEGMHGRQRRAFSHAFSEKSLRNQEWVIQKYSDMMISRLEETDLAQGKPSDLNLWYTWYTFDIITELALGVSFDCLADNKTHRYVALFLNGVKAYALSYCSHYWPIVRRLYNMFLGSPKITQMRGEWIAFLKQKVAARIGSETDRHDLLTPILPKILDESAQGEKDIEGVTIPEIVSNVNLFFAAGTETSATVLQFATYTILQHPAIYRKVCDEVRSRFKSQADITVEAVNNLTYTIAVLIEAMRCMAPVPAGFPRKVPSSGAMVSGYYLPGNCDVSVSMTQHASYHDPANFLEPDKFAPERWLGDAKYDEDNRSTFSPFSFGPRNCIGKNLAYAEMRVIFAKMIFSFDMEIAPGMEDWVDRCCVRAIWCKPPLLVKLARAR